MTGRPRNPSGIGGFKPGQSGNPSGVPQKPESIARALERKQKNKDIRDLCRAHTIEAVEALVDVVKSTTTPPAARVAAANSLLDRAWGKAPMHVETTVTTYEAMSERDLVQLITGKVIEGEVLRVLEEAEAEEQQLLEGEEEE